MFSCKNISDSVPHTIVTQIDKQSGYEWRDVSWRRQGSTKLLLGCSTKIHKIILKQEPRETIDLEITFDRLTDENFSKNMYYDFICTLDFHNDLHLLAQDYMYEVSCERYEDSSEFPEPLFTILEQRRSSSIKDIRKSCISTKVLQTENLRLYIRRCSSNDFKSDLKQNVNFQSLFEELPTDIILEVGESSLSAHKFVLSKRSEVFRAMFRNEMFEAKSGVVNIDGFDVRVIKEMIDYMYVGRVESALDSLVDDLYKAAHTYQLHDLCRYCEEYILFHSEYSNIADTLALADLYGIDHLKNSMWNFVEHHGIDMSKQTNFCNYLDRSMNENNVVKTLVFVAKFELKELKDKAIEFIAKNFFKMKDNQDFLDLFESHPILMKNVYTFYCRKYENDVAEILSCVQG